MLQGYYDTNWISNIKDSKFDVVVFTLGDVVVFLEVLKTTHYYHIPRGM